eukprot:TRINITY_DN27584_c0_g1_i1.p1 TRINITY_DN27584_c0_g1~~TRINITY_DN27584_c0_g1_i1.p1  ORF type:complete len:211 (-),score=24.68 TRINITY_DN27584_c0_g1_i1:268-900(-)
MEHLLQKGHPYFQSALQKEVHQLRPCLDFGGPPHPLRGDQPYHLVREKAKIVLNAVYQTRIESKFEFEVGSHLPQSSNLHPGDLKLGTVPYCGSEVTAPSGGSSQTAFSRLKGPTSIESTYKKPQESTGYGLAAVKNFLESSVQSWNSSTTMSSNSNTAEYTPEIRVYRPAVVPFHGLSSFTSEGMWNNNNNPNVTLDNTLSSGQYIYQF